MKTLRKFRVKTFPKILIITVLFCIYIRAYTQWVNMNNYVYAEFYKGAAFINSNTIVAAGSQGKIMKSTNGGVSWVPKLSNTTSYLQRVNFIDANNGFIVGSEGVILKSTDGGENWALKTSGTIKDLFGVHFFNLNTGVIIGGRDYDNNGNPWDYNNVILKTTNGGENWTTIQDNMNGLYTGLCFINETTGFAVGKDDDPQKSIIVKTTNAGGNWSDLDISSTIFLTAIDFANENTGFISGLNGTIYKTEDGGTTWSESFYSATSSIWDITVVNQNIVYASCSNGQIIETTNGGNNWNIVSTSVTYDLRGIYHNNEDYAMAFGYEGTVLKKTNLTSIPGIYGEKNNIILYPTYAYDKITLDNIEGIDEIAITNAIGQILEKIPVNTNHTNLDFLKYKKGIYLISFYSNHQIIETRKIIKY